MTEMIEVAMAKKREERYGATEDMLEDLTAVRRGDSPVHARRTVDLETLANVEESGKTVDLDPTEANGAVDNWSQSLTVVLLSVLGVSVLVNLVLLALWLSK